MSATTLLLVPPKPRARSEAFAPAPRPKAFTSADLAELDRWDRAASRYGWRIQTSTHRPDTVWIGRTDDNQEYVGITHDVLGPGGQGHAAYLVVREHDGVLLGDAGLLTERGYGTVGEALEAVCPTIGEADTDAQPVAG